MPKLLGVVLVLLALTAGCGDRGGREPAAGEPSVAFAGEVDAGPATVELREVDEVTAAGDVDCSKSEVAAPKAAAAACNGQGVGYRLAPAAWSGHVRDARAEIPTGQTNWVVSIALPADGAAAMAALSRRLAGTSQRVALVVDGDVLSAPTFAAEIISGQAQITGVFTKSSAHDLADKLTGR